MSSRKRKVKDSDISEYYNLDINQACHGALQDNHEHASTARFMTTPIASPCSSQEDSQRSEFNKRQVCKPIETHVHLTTLDRLYQAQINLARGGKSNPSPAVNYDTRSCEDCDKPIPEDEVDDLKCVNCDKFVCEGCSIRSIYRNNLSMCLHCS